MENTIRIGLSSCLLGNLVRYDGCHQYDPFLSETMGRFVEFVPVCPEAECGLGVPRETMRLVGGSLPPRLVTTENGLDHTERMCLWARQRINKLRDEGLQGFIFKSKSPSCGIERVKIYPPDGGLPKRVGVGLFAKAFGDAFPLLPVEDEARLHDLGRRDNFIERIFVCRRWQAAKNGPLSVSALISFHSKHKLQIMAHSAVRYRIMGRLVAQSSGDLPIETVFDNYESLLMAALRLLPTPKKHSNVLLHILGYFKKQLPFAEKQELLTIIDLCRLGKLPLIVPITLLLHCARKYQHDYLAEQTYLSPHPVELALRNHA